MLVGCGARSEWELPPVLRLMDARVDGTLADVVMIDRPTMSDRAVMDDTPDGSVVIDVVAPPVSDSECRPETVQEDCLRLFNASQDPEAVFQCCDGHCENGTCAGLCGGRLCNPRHARFCCVNPATRQLLCTLRDRGLCGTPP